MKVIALVSFLIAGVSCNYYGAPATVVRVLDTPAPLYQTVRDLPAYGSYGASLVRSTVPLIPITRYSQQIRGGVSDSTDFESGNGIRVSESTQVVAGRGGSYEGENGQMIRSESSLVKSGTYSYSAPDGTPISVSWTADENGFKAAGAHFPVPPPVPAEIAASLRAVNVPY